ncbi:radial spoke head protein 3 homolog isoform X1 [Synchiropus splendidus]|uniref:radial spoke head protein 3 homolog isoform X1 n=2 Tax=Synchiropus splendidus TaxID=270530 RepID=UPI00237DE5FD|nr:radial spoke head protein 3 homolog isoform X1 [Synchiropus splendidus]
MALDQQNQKCPEGFRLVSINSRPIENRSKYRQRLSAQIQSKYAEGKYDRQAVKGKASSGLQRNQADVQSQGRKAINTTRARDFRPFTPDPMEGRQNMDVQTELYLEELSDIIVTTEMECQTDAFVDKPPSPLFIPAKTGKDVATQIEEGELFDFDREVQPLLEVLVGKTIEQSLLEVMEEEELAALKAQQKYYEERRNAELAEVQRLQEQERRHTQEKENRIAQQKEVQRKEKEVAAMIAGRAFTQRYLENVIPSVFSALKVDGYIYDPVKKDIESNFLPLLMSEMNRRREQKELARLLLDSIIYELTSWREDQVN